MNRRGFLSTIAAAAVAPLLPSIPAPPLMKEGISLRFIRGYDAASGVVLSRMDVLYGFGSFYPEYACRVVDGPREWIRMKFDPARLPA